jgi:phosphoribosylformylglycinamidine synthase
LGETKDEIAGSLYETLAGADTMHRVHAAPTLPTYAPALYTALHHAIRQGLVRAAHDCSEGGLAVALAEMALAGQVGAVLREFGDWGLETWLFSESNGRIVVEVAPENSAAFETRMRGLPCALIGETRIQPGIDLAGGERLAD